jgi:hypothetical protein
MKKTLTSLLIILSLASCKKEDQTENTSLTGKWEWTGTDGGLAYHHDTPASTNKTIVFEFTADNQYTTSINGVIALQGTYTLGTKKCIHDHEMKPTINFSASSMPLMIERINSETLELSDENYDGFDSQYKRIKSGSN